MFFFPNLAFAALCFFLASWIAHTSAAASCSTTLTPTHSIKPSVASGYQVALIATGVSNPRSIQFDSLGNLLVLQSGHGIANLVLQDDGGTCIGVKSNRQVLHKGDVRIHNYMLRIFVSNRLIAEPWLGSVTRWENVICLFLRSCIFVDL